MNKLSFSMPKGASICESGGAISGLIGAAILAGHGSNADFGFVFFLISNCFLICFSIRANLPWLLIMQIGFTATSILGVYNGFLSHLF